MSASIAVLMVLIFLTNEQVRVEYRTQTTGKGLHSSAKPNEWFHDDCINLLFKLSSSDRTPTKTEPFIRIQLKNKSLLSRS